MTNTREELQAMEPATARTLLSEEIHGLAEIYVLAKRLQDSLARGAVVNVLD